MRIQLERCEKDAIKERVQHYLQDFYERTGKTAVIDIVTFDAKGTYAGRAYLKQAKVSFNQEIAATNKDRFDRTIAHEVAHIIAYKVYGESGHGRIWKSVFASFGFEPTRCHTYNMENVKVRRQRRWEYSCNCNTGFHQMTTTKHNKIQRGVRYMCVACGTPLEFAQEVAA